MGLITDFFVASREEFEHNFEDWLPVSKEKIEKINPVTKETYWDWEPDPAALSLYHQKKEQEAALQKKSADSQKKGLLAKIFGTSKSDQPAIHIPDIHLFPHVQYYRVDIVKLSTLYTILGQLTFEDALDEIAKPAYVIPDYKEQCIHILPQNFLNLLANIDADRFPQAANQWWKTEELQQSGFSEKDSREVILAISKLASLAISEGKYLFHWWCV